MKVCARVRLEAVINEVELPALRTEASRRAAQRRPVDSRLHHDHLARDHAG